ncbi:MAG: hypothetical protein Q9172_002579 [Xanthocarpia lactea]
MDHVPYPVSTSVPPVEVPLLVPYTTRGFDVPSSALEKTEEPGGADTESRGAPTQDHSVGSAFEADYGLATDWTLDFWRYPQKQGWSIDGCQPWWTSNAEETARRAQEWMYFELLHKFLRQPINVSSLARKDNNSDRILLDSSVVPELLMRWLARQYASKQDTQNYIGTISEGPRRESLVLSLLARVVLECDKLDDLDDPSQSTALAIRVLAETLTNAIYNLAHVKITETRNIRKQEHSSLLKLRFLNSGWCPFRIARLWGQYSPSTTYYLSSLSREPTFGGVKHDQCDETRCTTTSIDPSTYKPQHTESCFTDGSRCRMVGVRSSTVADCIKRGHIPLVRFEESVDGILRPEIVESRNGLRYVALSHVWSGGLGNVNMNSMFSCQIRKLYDLLLGIRRVGDDDYDRNLGTRKIADYNREVRKMFRMPLPEPPILLWIDTLCVPVGEEHQQTRQSAIAQMAQIYVEAQCVLVVDPELQKMNHTGLPDQQIFANVLCSSWNSRSWTFQEACMARVFYVQFLDGHCVVDEKWHAFMKSINRTTRTSTINSITGEEAINMHDVLMAEVSDWFRTMPVMTKTRGYDTRTLMSRSEDWQNFVRVWNGLRRRSTTKADDLYGIIAIMVDLSAYEILKLDPRERMKAILRAQSTLPISLLYQTCQKLCNLEGNPLWAPSEIAGDHLGMEGGYMSVEDDGLIIKLRSSDRAHHTWPGIYMFSTKGFLPISFSINVAGVGSTVSVKLHQTTAVGIDGTISSWVVLCEEALTRASTVHNVPGVLMSLRTLEGTTLITNYVCPLLLFSENVKADNAGENGFNENTKPLPQALKMEAVSLEEYSIKINTVERGVRGTKRTQNGGSSEERDC